MPISLAFLRFSGLESSHCHGWLPSGGTHQVGVEAVLDGRRTQEHPTSGRGRVEPAAPALTPALTPAPRASSVERVITTTATAHTVRRTPPFLVVTTSTTVSVNRTSHPDQRPRPCQQGIRGLRCHLDPVPPGPGTPDPRAAQSASSAMVRSVFTSPDTSSDVAIDSRQRSMSSRIFSLGPMSAVSSTNLVGTAAAASSLCPSR